jgi:hypothetical protein
MEIKKVILSREDIDDAIAMYLQKKENDMDIKFGSVYLDDFDDDGDEFTVVCNHIGGL